MWHLTMNCSEHKLCKAFDIYAFAMAGTWKKVQPLKIYAIAGNWIFTFL